MQTVKLPVVAHLTPEPAAFQRPIRLRPSPQSMSWEGIGLSVTFDDEEVIDAWRHIASLPHDAVRLCRLDGKPGRFVLWTRALERQATTWAVEHGWLKPTTGWEVSWYDVELDERRFSVFPTHSEAEEEAADQEEQGEETEPRIRKVTTHVPTSKLLARWLKHFGGEAGPEFAVVEATNLYVANAAPDADGIWWDETLDPAALSAPRGVILPQALPRWAAC